MLYSSATLSYPRGILSGYLRCPAHPVTMSNYVRPGLPYQVLEVKSVTGPLDVTPTLVEGDGLLGINLASDTMPAQLVEDAKVQTYFKTLYLFKFCILNPLLKLKFYKVEPTFLLLWSWSYSTILAWLQLVNLYEYEYEWILSSSRGRYCHAGYRWKSKKKLHLINVMYVFNSAEVWWLDQRSLELVF